MEVLITNPNNEFCVIDKSTWEWMEKHQESIGPDLRQFNGLIPGVTDDQKQPVYVRYYVGNKYSSRIPRWSLSTLLVKP